MRKRRFKDKAIQKVYDTYLETRPDPEKERVRGSLGHAYFVGRMDKIPMQGRFRRVPVVVGSLAYGAWAAGLDIARDELVKAKKAQKTAA